MKAAAMRMIAKVALCVATADIWLRFQLIRKAAQTRPYQIRRMNGAAFLRNQNCLDKILKGEKMQQTLLNLAQKYDKKYIKYCKKFENICEQIYNTKVIKAMISPQTTQDSGDIIYGFFIFSKTFYHMREADLSNFFANLESKKESQISHFLDELMQGILQFLKNYLSFLNALESNIKMLKVYMLGYNYFCKFEIVNFNFCLLAKLFSHNILDNEMLNFCSKMLIFWDVDEMIMSDISCDIDSDEFQNIELEIVKNRGVEFRKFMQNTDFTSKDSIKKGFILYVKNVANIFKNIANIDIKAYFKKPFYSFYGFNYSTFLRGDRDGVGYVYPQECSSFLFFYYLDFALNMLDIESILAFFNCDRCFIIDERVFRFCVKKGHNPNIGRHLGDKLNKGQLVGYSSNIGRWADDRILKKDSIESSILPTHHHFNKKDSILGFKNLKDFEKYKHNIANLIFIESNLCETFKRKKSLKSRQKILQTSQFYTLYKHLNLESYSKDSILKHYKTFSLFLLNLTQELFW
ncbi:hypothetical protein [Helicobacter saguini]|uniref:Uncharacterized protein n=2 Tax=Helicobacter saguini TaxID=1548018 RepID=A0A6B0HM79_9HELI|nr:hypothetical protein [Helicobacter saguini]MWV60969.1 hypothetical protein [Helicobacter saguini]MWV70173.1 hypothetical protein [Helicobacter saguini]MWV72076.1 hypothetical protein [Helicobacter saguini]